MSNGGMYYVANVTLDRHMTYSQLKRLNAKIDDVVNTYFAKAALEFGLRLFRDDEGDVVLGVPCCGYTDWDKEWDGQWDDLYVITGIFRLVIVPSGYGFHGSIELTLSENHADGAIDGRAYFNGNAMRVAWATVPPADWSRHGAFTQAWPMRSDYEAIAAESHWAEKLS